MSTVLADGIYQISNTKYPGYAADLVNGNPSGPISVYLNGSGPTSHWRLKNLGNNQITLENVSVSGVYASSYVQLQGAPLTGSVNPTIWVVRELIGANNFLLTTVDEKFTWALPLGENYVTIELQPSGVNETNALWKFQSVTD